MNKLYVILLTVLTSVHCGTAWSRNDRRPQFWQLQIAPTNIRRRT